MANTLTHSTPRIRHPLVNSCPPTWASGWGQDAFGIFAEISVPASDGEWVIQRLRWLPPGTFLMGSPEDEPGREADEGPQHQVIISKAFWMFDTPCTQALWQTVMGDNPNHFVDPQRPVDSVSWDNAQDFITKLNALIPGLALRLPTEAEWEYACRAGTNEATYVGSIKILGQCHAPILDEIAWYGGNSGVGFDLDNGWDASGWPEKQYDHQKAGTRRVAEKRPNRWGLFDMLGNVWEWCLDWYDEEYYQSSGLTDPSGPIEGDTRVVRGGSWINLARRVRSASRRFNDPSPRTGLIGFRCAQAQDT